MGRPADSGLDHAPGDGDGQQPPPRQQVSQTDERRKPPRPSGPDRPCGARAPGNGAFGRRVAGRHAPIEVRKKSGVQDFRPPEEG